MELRIGDSILISGQILTIVAIWTTHVIAMGVRSDKEFKIAYEDARQMRLNQ